MIHELSPTTHDTAPDTPAGLTHRPFDSLDLEHLGIVEFGDTTEGGEVPSEPAGIAPGALEDAAADTEVAAAAEPAPATEVAMSPAPAIIATESTLGGRRRRVVSRPAAPSGAVPAIITMATRQTITEAGSEPATAETQTSPSPDSSRAWQSETAPAVTGTTVGVLEASSGATDDRPEAGQPGMPPEEAVVDTAGTATPASTEDFDFDDSKRDESDLLAEWARAEFDAKRDPDAYAAIVAPRIAAIRDELTRRESQSGLGRMMGADYIADYLQASKNRELSYLEGQAMIRGTAYDGGPATAPDTAETPAQPSPLPASEAPQADQAEANAEAPIEQASELMSETELIEAWAKAELQLALRGGQDSVYEAQIAKLRAELESRMADSPLGQYLGPDYIRDYTQSRKDSMIGYLRGMQALQPKPSPRPRDQR